MNTSESEKTEIAQQDRLVMFGVFQPWINGLLGILLPAGLVYTRQQHHDFSTIVPQVELDRTQGITKSTKQL
jgi:hypothetical protein